jgi:hypothetical protein
MSSHEQQATAALLAATFLIGCLSFAPLSVRPQQRDRSVTANQQNDQSQLPEPVMRIALSTNTRAATISTAAQLLNASDLIGAPQPLETSRVRVESRVLSPQASNDQDVEITLARALSREDADRLVKSVSEVTDEEAKALVDAGDKWRVVVVKQSLEDAETAIEKLEAAGFDATLSSGKATETIKPSDSSGLTRPRATNAPTAAGANTASTRTNPPNRVRLTSRAMAPNREVLAFAGGRVAAAFQRSTHVRVKRRDERAGQIQRQTVSRPN